MQAKDIMTKEVFTITLEATIKEAIDLCVCHKVSGLIVVNASEEAVGVLSEQDLLIAFDFLGETKSSIKEFISTEILSIPEDMPIVKISRILVQKNFKRVPVVRDKKVVGIVSRSDILKWIKESSF